MPLCFVCFSRWEFSTKEKEFDICDCGRCLTRDEFSEMEDAEVSKLREAWRNSDEHEKLMDELKHRGTANG